MKASQKNEWDSSRIVKEFEGEVRHIHGNLFRVALDAISKAREGISAEDGRLVYGNPRWFSNENGEMEARGIEEFKMEELKSSIKERGVDHPIRLRVAESGGGFFLEIVNGERRFRAINEMIDADEKCFDVASGSALPASEVYGLVECRIEYMDDDTALRCALAMNETSEVIGESANINVVKVLRESGYDDQDILRATGKSFSWLRETERIIGLDKVCLENFQNETINRNVALRLALIEDMEERMSTLDRILSVSRERHQEKVAQSKKKAERARMDAEVEDAMAQSASKKGNGDLAEKHKANSKVASARAKQADEQSEKMRSSKSKATGKDMDKAQGGSNKPLSHAKINSKYMKPLEKLLANNGVCDDHGEFDVILLMAIQSILESIMAGNSDIWSVLEEHCVLSEGVTKSEEDSEIEDSGEDEDDEDEDDNEDPTSLAFPATNASEDEEDEDEDEDEDSEIEASDDEDEEDEDEDSEIEASDDEDEEDDEDSDSYTEAEAVKDLEREFEKEARNW